MRPRLNGLIAAPFTPLHPDGGLNLKMIEQQADLLAADGVKGAFICGTTGEGLSLTTAERRQVVETWMAAAANRFAVIIHVGHNNLGESQELAAHAEKIGVEGIATIGPTFFRPANVEQLAEYCARVAESAPTMPFYYYYMPAMTGVNLPMIELLKIASKRIPNFAGIKFTDENLMSFAQCLNFEDGRFNILFGRDEILLAALALGATGAVGSTYGYMGPVYHQMWAAFDRGDLEAARRYQFIAIQIIAVMSRHGGLAAGKAMMKMIGIDCGPVRPPLRNLSADELEVFRRELEHAGFPSLVKLARSNFKTTAPAPAASTKGER